MHSIWRDLWPTRDCPHLFWGTLAGAGWVAHYSPVTAGPGLRYTLLVDGIGGWHLHTFDRRPSQDEVGAAVAGWFRRPKS